MAYTQEQELWKQAQEMAKEEYENNFGSWEDADKYEREDFVFKAFEDLKNQNQPKTLDEVIEAAEEKLKTLKAGEKTQAKELGY